MEDIDIQCAAKGCNEVRVFTVRDQEFYKQKGFQTPRYCKTHSAERKARHNSKTEEREQDDRDHRGYSPKMPEMEGDASMLGDY